MAPTSDFPWAFSHYEAYTYIFLDGLTPAQMTSVVKTPLAGLNDAMGNGRYTYAYFIVTRSAEVAVQYTAAYPGTAMPALIKKLTLATGYRIVYLNRDAVIYRLMPSAGSSTPTVTPSGGPSGPQAAPSLSPVPSRAVTIGGGEQ